MKTFSNSDATSYYRARAIAVTAFIVAVLLVLGIANLVWKIPKPLLLVSGAFFLAWTALFWIVGLRAQWPLWGQVIRTFATWAATATLLLCGVYYWDRGGWMWLQISGYNVTMPENFAGNIAMPVASFLDANPLFSIDSRDSTKLILPEGAYQIDKTIVVPKGLSLTIAPGAVLRFKVGCSLISYGSIIACGTEKAPIVFTAQNEWRKWGAVGIVSRELSVFDRVIFENGRQALVNGIEFTGCLSLMGSEVQITNSRFIDLYGKDAVNVRQGRVLIQNNVFENTFKDGLDLDGGVGLVSHNRFVNCGDEGIDLSENDRLNVFDNQVVDIQGGRIAAEKNLDLIKSQNTLARSEI